MSVVNMFSYQVSNADVPCPLPRSHTFVALKPSKYGAAARRPQPCAKLAKGFSGLVRPCLNWSLPAWSFALACLAVTAIV